MEENKNNQQEQKEEQNISHGRQNAEEGHKSASNEPQTTESGSGKAGRDSKKKKSHGSVHPNELEELGNKLIELNDKYLRLSAEFDNYRKRTLKEKMELTKTGGEKVLTNLLPVIDNLERGLVSVRQTTDIEAVKQGIELIYNNFLDFLKQNGVQEIECLNQDFDSDLHDAITKIPAPQPELKGKVVDVIQKGYYLNDRVMRFARVVVGD